MDLKSKITIVLTGLGILLTSVTFNALDKACVFDAEIVRFADQQMCFKSKEDYAKYKAYILAWYKPNNNNMFMWVEGEQDQFSAIVNKEVKRKQFKNIGSFDDLIAQIK